MGEQLSVTTATLDEAVRYWLGESRANDPSSSSGGPAQNYRSGCLESCAQVASGTILSAPPTLSGDVKQPSGASSSCSLISTEGLVVLR